MPDNLEFFRKHGAPGCIGLVGGTAAVDRGIRYAQRHLNPGKAPSLWSHVFVFQGERVDGRPWLLESDFDVTKGRLRSGVQENRVEKYGDPKEYPNLAVLDFRLKAAEVARLLSAGLDFVVRRTPYALTGALKTYWAVLTKGLAQAPEKDEIYCSAFVRALYRHVSIDLAPGIAVHHTTPEHVARAEGAARYERLLDGPP